MDLIVKSFWPEEDLDKSVKLDSILLGYFMIGLFYYLCFIHTLKKKYTGRNKT